MKKEEVELILFKVLASGQEAINMKIYKNGTTCRLGVGGLPQLGISGMSFFNDSRYFDPLIAKVPQDILETPINHEESPNGDLEYVIAFYGVSKNGETGERADWSKSTGVRVKIDQQTGFNHPIMGFLDELTMDAIELTNSWYFDVVMHAKWKAKSSVIPEETMIVHPKTEEETHQHYDYYINQMVYSARKWSLADCADGKTYERDGSNYQLAVAHTDMEFRLDFVPVAVENNSELKSKQEIELPNETPQPEKKKPWWRR